MSATFMVGCGMFFLRAALLLSCFWIVYWFLRPHPRARVLLCRIVSVSIVLLPALNFLPMPAIFNLPEFGRARVEQPNTPAEVVPAPASAAVEPQIPVVIPPEIVATPGGSPTASELPPVSKPIAVRVKTSGPAWKLPQWPLAEMLTIAWLALALLRVARWGVSLFWARRLARRAQAPPGWVLEEGRRLGAQLGIRKRVAFGVAENVCSPLLLGPGALILLPRRLVAEGASPDARAALAHELVHVRQGDWHWSQWLHLVGVLTWPLPLVWFLRRAHDASGELVCDHVAANSVGGAESYAGSLARQSLHAIGRPIPAAVPMLRKPGIRHRIELLLSGVKLPSLSWRVTLCAGILTLLSAGLLSGLQLARAADKAASKADAAAQNKDVQKEFETLAGETSYLDMWDAVTGQTGYTPALSGKDWDRYTAFLPRFRAVRASREELIPLLKHKDSKVRTLAMAALASLNDPAALPFIADLLDDDAVTFWQNGPGDRDPPPLRKNVTVGEAARQLLTPYLSLAGYGSSGPAHPIDRKEFDDYWSAHKDCAWCASWFAVRLGRVPDIYPDEYDKAMRPIRADADKMPLPERFWVALRLRNKVLLHKLSPAWRNHELPRPLYTDEELVAMGRQIGPDALMNVLKARQLPGDDPDLQHENLYMSASAFVLQNATALLRPQDMMYQSTSTTSDALLALNSGIYTSAAWLVAAAWLQPAKAGEILRQGFAQFKDDYNQGMLAAALWQLGGESQLPFIVDRFYEDAAAGHTSAGYFFISAIVSIEKPSGRKIIAAILQDKRLDDLKMDRTTFFRITSAVHDWTKKPVAPEADLADASKQIEVLHRMRDSVPEWIDAANVPPSPASSPAQSTDIKTQFEKLAGESSYFEINDILRSLTEFSTGGTADDDARYAAFVAHFRAIHAGKEALAPLLTHENPKVRTLAIAALAALDDPTALPYIADLLSDDAATFARSGSDQRPGSQLPNGPASNATPRVHVSVGENAQAVIAFYLDPAKYFGYDPVSNGSRTDDQKTRKEFAAYWDTHKDRAYCASWFAERLERIVQSDSGAVRGDRAILGGIRADLDKVPQPDRAWIALWLNGDFPNALYSDKELVEMCAKLGPDALMAALQKHHYPGDDPDLQRARVEPPSVLDVQTTDAMRNDDFQPAEKFILKNATTLLRPQDAQALVQLYTWYTVDNRDGAPVPGTPKDVVAMTRKNTPLAFIAAARLQPGKAVEILRPAYAQFAGDSLAYDRCELDAALWELGGESQTSFLTDQFYYETGRQTAPMDDLIDRIAATEKPPGKNLIGAILQDKRLDDIDVDRGTLSSLAKAVNGWAKKQVVSKDEVRKASLVTAKDWRPDPSTRKSRTELLDRLRDSMPAWTDSTASGDQVPRPQATSAQKADVKKEFEAIAAMSDYFEINDILHERAYFSTGVSNDVDAKYQAMMKRFLAVHATEEELLALLKHDDPKVRTLAIAALASLPSPGEPTVLPAIGALLSDNAHTFDREGTLRQQAEKDSGQPPTTNVTVADEAREVLTPYQEIEYSQNGDGRLGFAELWSRYWDRRKRRAWCAGWFEVRARRIASAPVMEGDASDAARATLAARKARLRAIRDELDKIPQPDRTWTALWLNERLGPALYSNAELLDMCRKLGPDVLMSAFQAQQFTGDDPDLKCFGDVGSFADCVGPVLGNAAALLSPEDADALVAIGAKSNSPLWVIAAARLQPAKAGDILQAAYPQFDKNPDDQQRLLLALWELGGGAQAPFIVDRFYNIIQASNDSSGSYSGDDFAEWVIGTKNPPGRKLIAAILNDKRIDAFQRHGRIVASIATAVNGWAGKPIVSDAEIEDARKGIPAKISNPEPPDLPLRIQLLHRMRDTAGEWNK